MFLYVIGVISTTNPSFKSAKEAAKLYPPHSQISVYIDSQGGLIDEAYEFGKALSVLRPTCFVKNAASAALEVIMPACQKIVLMPESTLQFHSATWCIQGMRSTADILKDLRQGLAVSVFMAELMENLWGPAVCSKEINAKYPELSSFNCSLRHMIDETSLTGSQFTVLYPGAAKRVTILPKEKFPQIKKIPVEEGAIEKKRHPKECEVF